MDINPKSSLEDEDNLCHKFSKLECLEILLNLAEENPDKIITRDFFRKEAGFIFDKDWVPYFGTFTEFKRQANLSPTRSENTLLSKVAIQASVDNIREYNKEKYEWSTLYNRDSPRRFQKFLVLSDIHDILCDPFYRRMSIVAAHTYKPQKIIFNGDLFDLPEFSKYGKRVEEFDPRPRQDWVHSYLTDLRNVVHNDTEFNLVEGNHEFRLVKYFLENAPLVMHTLHLQGINVREFLGLDEFNVNYYSRADFGATTDAEITNEVKRNYYQFKDIVLFHHYQEGKKFGMPGCSGHHHKFYSWPFYNKTYGPYRWFQSAGGIKRHVDYFNTMGEMWENGFYIVNIDLYNKKNTWFQEISCTNEHCWLDGRRYTRNEEEKLFLV